MKAFLTIASLLLLSVKLLAQLNNQYENLSNALTNKLDTYLLSAVKVNKFNGAALVAKDGKIVFNKAYGWRNFSYKTKNEINTRFPILSITKSFTAIVLLKLQEQGKLSMRDKISKYLPEYPNGNKISIEHLLTHTSGIYNYTDNVDEGDSIIVCHPVSKQLVLDQFKDKPLAFKPGKQFSYNNSGYYLAGMVIEKVTGKPYESIIRDIIFEPLGMSSSGFDYNNLPSEMKAVGYQFLNGKMQKPYPFYDSTVGYAAGSIYSTTEDLYKWSEAIANGQLLSSSSWIAAFTPKIGDYGYGFQTGNYQGKKYVTHSGGYPGYISMFMFYPKDRVTIILLNNVGNYGQDLWSVTMGISNILFGLPNDLWQFRENVYLSEGLLKQKEGKYKLGKLQFTVFVKDNQLHLIHPSGKQFILLAESEDIFYIENFNTQFHFVREQSGRVEKMVVHEYGKDHEWAKVK
jgi:CubicO group peptidase (beta-lactamase class C family)